MPRAERPPGPLRAQLLRRRRAFGRSRPGRTIKRILGREVPIPVLAAPDPEALIDFPGEDELPPELRDRAIVEQALAIREEAPRPRRSTHTQRPAPLPPAGERPPITNVVLVSHCNFRGNSAFHVHAVACELHRRGLSPVIAIPDEPETVEEVGRPPFPVLTYDEVRGGGIRFPDGRGPDLVHAWTPRELVRRLTVDLVRAHGCRYVVHLEDNEETVLAAEHGGIDVHALKELPLPVLDRIVRPRQAHPFRAARFLELSAGMTVLVERLLEFVPPSVPAVVIRAGFDESVLSPKRSRDEVRAELGLAPDELAIVYPGNIHLVNIEEVRALYQAVAQLRAAGQRVVLVKTGWGSTQTVDFPALGAGGRDLGWVPRHAIPELLAAADVLVQPGAPGPFNDYRLPSKLPEFLASGRPVLLPRANLGLELRDGEEAVLLDCGDADEIAAAVARVAAQPALRAALGAAGRAFALRELRWPTAAEHVCRLYAAVAAEERPPPPIWALEGADPPVKLVAVVPAAPTADEARAARSAGVYAFSLDDHRAAAAASADCRLAVPPPAASAVAASDSQYATLLRKHVLEALLLRDRREPLVVIDASAAWTDRAERSVWLARTRDGLRHGLRQYYASRHLTLADAELEELVAAG